MNDFYSDSVSSSEATVTAEGANILEKNVFRASYLPFKISLISFLGLLALLFLVPLIESMILVTYGEKVRLGIYFYSDNSLGPLGSVVAAYIPHIMLFIITLASAYVGYKLVQAAGASPANPIPPGNYKLLAPLIAEGKSEAIDQYVRLSSLSGFTGTFTKLGLTGLPLATIVLTLIFSGLAILPLNGEMAKSFMDLAKLTLGAFIGSFVQRQVEQRKATDPVARLRGDQSTPPSMSS